MRFILYINTQTSHLSRSHPTSLSDSDVLHNEGNAIMACVHCIPWGSAAQQATFAILTRGWKAVGVRDSQKENTSTEPIKSATTLTALK